MPLWLTLVVIGIVLAILGITGIAHLLLWIGIVVLVVGVIGTLIGRGRA